MKEFTTGQIIKGVRERDNKVLSLIYKEVFPVVRYYVISKGGTLDDAKDVFQESIIIAFRQIRDNSLEIKTSFEAYLYGVARLVWLKILRNKEIHDRNVSKLDEPETAYNISDEIIEEELEMRLFRKHFQKLGKECQKVLSMSSDGINNEHIANEMGYKSEKIARNKKYKCKEALIKRIKEDPEYKNIKGE